MMALSRRPYAGEPDLEPIAHLINTCEAHDRLDEGTSVPVLRQELDTPSLDKERDISIWEDDRGQIVGFGQLWIPQKGSMISAWLWFRVHPSRRDGIVETEIVKWGEARMREVARERRVTAKLLSHARADRGDRIHLLEQCGFKPDRYFFRMARSLKEPLPKPQCPEGFVVRPSAGVVETSAWVELYNQSFIDHWNYHEITVEDASHALTHPDYRPDLDLIAIAPDGMLAAFCYCHINRNNNLQTGRNEGWITMLATRREFRHRGLGRALLLTGMQQLQAGGMETVLLGVDLQNSHGALQLYESVGFQKVHTNVFFAKDL